MLSFFTCVISFLHFFFQLANNEVPEGISSELKRSEQYHVKESTGVFDASDFGITGNGMEMSGKINQALSQPDVKKLIFKNARQYILVNGSINVPAGKVLQFENGARITGSGSIKNATIRADKNAWIFDKQMTVHLLDTTAQFSVKWYGAKGDGITDDSEPIRSVFEMARQKKGGNIFFPAGTYIVSRQKASPFKIIAVYSNTTVKGEGMYVSTVKLAPGDMANFRRIFALGDSSGDVVNVEIANLGIDLSNTYKTYPPPASFGNDAQSSGIFCYGDPYLVQNAYFHDLFIHDVTGDIIGISKNSRNITIERIYQRDYLRQGISIGGNGGVDSITVKHIYDLPFENGVQKGGNSIHTEPAAVVKNVSYQYCRISDFSASGINGLFIDSVVTTSASDNKCNNVEDFFITRSILEGRLQVAPTGPGRIQDNVLNKGVYITSVGKGGFRAMKDIFIGNNFIRGEQGKSVIKVNQVSGVNINNNTIEANANAIEFVNSGDGSATGNKITVTNKRFLGISVSATIASRYGEGMFVIDSNIISNADKGIRAANVSCVVGKNNITIAGTPVVADISTARLFPFEKKEKRELGFDKMPQWGIWNKGDSTLR